MTTHTCVAQYAIAQKAKEKALNPKLLSPFFGERRQGWRSAGIFGVLFCRLTPTQHARSLSEAAWPPACIVAGSFGARQGGLQGRPSAQHVPASLFGNRRAGPARWSGGGKSQAQLTDTTHPLSHSQSLSRRRLPRSTSAFPSRLFHPLLLPMCYLPPCRGLKSHFNCPFFAAWPSPLRCFVSHRCDVITNGPGRECRWIFLVSLSLWFNWLERPTWTRLCAPLWLIYSRLYITVPLLNAPLWERHDQIFKNSSQVPQCHVITLVIVVRLIFIIYWNMQLSCSSGPWWDVLLIYKALSTHNWYLNRNIYLHLQLSKTQDIK